MQLIYQILITSMHCLNFLNRKIKEKKYSQNILILQGKSSLFFESAQTQFKTFKKSRILNSLVNQAAN